MLGLKSNVKRIANIIYIAVSVLIIGLAYQYNLSIVLVVVNIIIRIIYTRFFNGKVKLKIFYVSIYYIITVLSEVVSIILVSLLFKVNMQQVQSVGYLNIITQVIYATILLILAFILSNIKAFKNINMPTKYWALLLSAPVSGFTIFLVIDLHMDISTTDYRYLILFCMMIVSTIYTYILIGFLFNKLSAVFKNRNLDSLLDQQKNYQLKFYENMRASDKEIRNVRHDLNNHLQCTYDLLMTNRFDDAKSYIETVSNAVQINNRIINTGNVVFDSILNAKIGIIKNVGIDFDYSIEIPAGIKIDPMDVCVILGNSIDNAIEACSRIKDGSARQISLIATYRNKGLIFSIKNTADSGSLVKKGDVYISSKNNPSEHGIGISNINRTAEKYNGIVVINNKANMFELSAALYNV
jgi:signal transduction histidine kinase